MRKYQIIFTFFILILFLINLYFDLNNFQKTREIYLKDFNKSIINFKQILLVPQSKIYKNDFKLWDMQPSNIIKLKEEQKSKKDNEKEQKQKKQRDIKVKYREICVEEQCWQLTGIMSINNTKNLILIKKDKKPKIEIFKIGDELLPKIPIININGDSMVLLNKEKNQKIILKLFDIDISKYKPKVVKDKNE